MLGEGLNEKNPQSHAGLVFLRGEKRLTDPAAQCVGNTWSAIHHAENDVTFFLNPDVQHHRLSGNVGLTGILNEDNKSLQNRLR